LGAPYSLKIEVVNGNMAMRASNIDKQKMMGVGVVYYKKPCPFQRAIIKKCPFQRVFDVSYSCVS